MTAASSGARPPSSGAATAGGRMGDMIGGERLCKTGAFMRREGARRLKR